MYERPSCFKLKPGLDEDVIAAIPQAAAPYTILIAATSLSACNTTIPVLSIGFCSMKYSITSDCGVIGYPK